jgi:hypothetical protein
MKAELINIGRGKVCDVVTVKDFDKLYLEVKRHLFSRYFDLEETEDPSVYEVVAGFRIVGQVKILEE